VATRRGRPTQAEAKKLDLAVRGAAVATFVEMGCAGALPARMADFGVFRSKKQQERHLQYAVKLYFQGVVSR